MIYIDGSLGEGGGQILRSALSLSTLTGKPFRISNIRAGRDKPGLMRQHLAAVNAAKAICGAEVSGAQVGSQELQFEPGPLCPGDFEFAVGTAGSAMLVFQTVLLPLLRAAEPSELRLRGGTHNPFAPPFEFVEQTFLPLLARMGAEVQMTLIRPGFYPAGGGEIAVHVTPCRELLPLRIVEPAQYARREAKAFVAALPRHIAERELAVIRDRLGFTEDETAIRQLAAEHGPGNIVTVTLESELVTEVFTGFGEKTKSAETVAEEVCTEVNQHLASGAPIGKHTADQLLLPLALAGGGSFRTVTPTQHTITNMQIIPLFLNVECSWAEEPGGASVVTVETS